MEMTQESLVASGFTQEQAKQILDAHKAAISGSYIPKARFDEVNTQLTTANATIAERDTQIKSLEAFKGTNEELQAKVTQLQADNQAKDAEMKKALETERVTNAAINSLTGKAHDPNLVLSQIDMSRVTLGQDGKLSGFDEQVKSLQEAKKFLFVEGTEPKDTPNPYAGFKVVGKTPVDGNPAQPEIKTAEDFGANLAKRKLEAQEAANKAQDHYFKGGN